jgi:hypothetical protein
MITPATWEAVGVRALIGLGALAVMAIALAAYAAGRRDGRRPR